MQSPEVNFYRLGYIIQSLPGAMQYKCATQLLYIQGTGAGYIKKPAHSREWRDCSWFWNAVIEPCGHQFRYTVQ